MQIVTWNAKIRKNMSTYLNKKGFARGDIRTHPIHLGPMNPAGFFDPFALWFMFSRWMLFEFHVVHISVCMWDVILVIHMAIKLIWFDLIHKVIVFASAILFWLQHASNFLKSVAKHISNLSGRKGWVLTGKAFRATALSLLEDPMS